MKHSLLKSLIVSLFLLFSIQVDAQNINMTNGGNSQACGGTFSDPGGAGNYSGGNNTYIHTICSSNPGEFPKIDFTSFSLYSSSSICSSKGDKLEIFDGPNVSSPPLGTYTGTSTPGQSFIGTTGCLTFRFTTIASHSSGFACLGNTNNPGAPGWSATITCLSELPPSGDNCPEAIPFCSDQSYTFPNSISGTAPSGPNYGCLTSRPKPIWYFMKIGQSGPMQLHLAEFNNNGNGIDIDFAMWGPFTDLPSGCSQIMGGGLSPLQCSFSSSSTETIGLGLPGGTGSGASTPPVAQVGEYYILLLTNYDGAKGYFTLEQTNGTGQTDCSIINPCSISNFTANISACSNDLYSIDGTVVITEPPATGDLIVVDCNGNQTIVASAPFNASTYNYTLNNLDADGNACSVQAYFSDETTCTQTLNYTAPICTIPTCHFSLLDISIHPCNANNTFDITGTVEFSNPPTTGQLVIEDCNGNSDTYNAPFTSPQTFSILGIATDGANCNITASFSADPGCTIDISYTNVSDCSCSANIGTLTVTTDGTKSGNNITLCEGQSFTFLTNGDYTPPNESTNIPPLAPYDPGIWWVVYNCPPTYTSNVDVNADPCVVTFLNAASITDLNDMAFINAFPPGTFTNNTVYFAPITMYNITDGVYAIVSSGIYCYQMGAPYAVQYLPPVTTNETSDCQAGTVSVAISGGSPAINGTNFTATNLTPSTASFTTSSVGNNGTIVVSGLQDGDSYAFDIEDEFGCAVNISGTFQGVSASGFAYNETQYCQDEPNPTPTVFGAAGGAFTATPSGLSINGSTGTINLGSSTPGTYNIVYTSPGAPCNSTSDHDVTINPVPTFTIAKTDPTCGDDNGTITISGLDPSDDYQVIYYDPSGAIVGPATITTDASGEIVFANLPPGSYESFIIKNTEGCSTTDPGPINLIDQAGPTVTAPIDVIICLGETVTLTATNPDGATITWNNSVSDGTVFTPTATGTITYTVTATDANSCTATDDVDVIVNGLPTIDAGLTQSICNGDDVTLTGSGAGTGGTYTWNHGVTDGTVFNPTTTETYQVTGEDANGCENTDDVIVTVNPVPTFTLSHDDPTCGNNDGSITISGLVPNSSYQSTYTNPSGSIVGPTSLTANASGEIVIPNLPQGSYSNFIIENSDGCSTTQSTAISLNDLGGPSVTAPNDIAICLGEDVTLTATNPDGATITWNNSVTDGTAFTPTAAGTVNYVVTATDVNGCTATDNVDVTVNALPTINAGQDQSICNGGNVTLTGTGAGTGAGTGGTYTWDHGVTNGVAFTPGTTETYQVTGEDANGCENTDDVIVTVNPLPTFTVSHNNPTCGNNDGSITISGLDPSTGFDVNYNFNGTPSVIHSYTSNGSGDILIANLGQGSYSNFKVTTAAGCSSTVTATEQLVEPNAPSVTAPNNIDICLGESVTLTAENPSGATLSWNNGINDGVAFTPTSVGVTTYIVTATIDNCSSSDNVNVTVHAAPTVNAGADKIICQGASTTLTATGATSYNWTTLGGGASQMVSPSSTTTYEVTGTDNFGCTNTDQVVVTVNAIPVPQFEGSRLEGCEPLTVTFTNLNPISGVSCKWDFGDGNTSTLCDNVIHVYQSSGTYNVSLTVTDAIGCTGTLTLQNYIKVKPRPDAMFTADPMITGVSSPEITFTNETVNGTDFIWIFGDGTPVEYTYDAIHTYPDKEFGNYVVTLIASNGPDCNDTVQAVIKIEDELIFYIPNSFTPDNDEFNETFKPIFSSGFDPQTYTLSIYDRWGEIIFESHNTEIGWKGTYGENSSTIVKQGTYVWKVEIKETGHDKRNTYTGHVNLLK